MKMLVQLLYWSASVIKYIFTLESHFDNNVVSQKIKNIQLWWSIVSWVFVQLLNATHVGEMKGGASFLPAKNKVGGLKVQSSNWTRGWEKKQLPAEQLLVLGESVVEQNLCCQHGHRDEPSSPPVPVAENQVSSLRVCSFISELGRWHTHDVMSTCSR